MIVFFDTETTGLGKSDEILSIAIVDERGKKLFYKTVKPQFVQSWPEAQKVHGISPDNVKNKPPLKHYEKQIEKWLNGKHTIGGYNVNFDIRMLRQSGYNIGNVQTIDVMDIAKEHFGNKQKLSEVAHSLGYEFKAHDALNDAAATAYVYRKLTGQKDGPNIIGYAVLLTAFLCFTAGTYLPVPTWLQSLIFVAGFVCLWRGYKELKK